MSLSIKASDPSYPAIKQALDSLGEAYNPECWHMTDATWEDYLRARESPERHAWIELLLQGMGELIGEEPSQVWAEEFE